MEEKEPQQNSSGSSGTNDEHKPVVAAVASPSSEHTKSISEPSPHEVTMGTKGFGTAVAASAAAESSMATSSVATAGSKKDLEEQLDTRDDPPHKRQKVSASGIRSSSTSSSTPSSITASAAAEAATPRPPMVTADSSVPAAATTTTAAVMGRGSTPVKTPDTAPESTASLREGGGELERDDHDSVLLQPQAQHDLLSSIPDQELNEEEDQKPRYQHMPPVKRSASSASVASDLSSSSASTMAHTSSNQQQESQESEQRHELSPVPTAYVREIPPAPPSTPASSTGSIAWDTSAAAGCATPLPIRASVQNASLLEQQMLMMDGAATPAPQRPEAQAFASQPTPGTAGTAATTKTGAPQMPPLPEDFSDWAVGDRYEMVRILGRGSYGEVAQAIDLHEGRRDAFVAIKRIQSPFDQEVDAIRLYREIHILRQMRGHDCIIQLVDVVQPPTDDLDDFHDLYLVFEYVDTDLYKLIMSPQYLTTEHIQTFLYQMLAGLKYIHSFSVIHRDLKPANILLNEDCSLKICDFGLARIVDSTTMYAQREDGEEGGLLRRPTSFAPPPMGLTRQLTKHVVTRWYRAPELILIQPYTSAVDIWSLGCILAELLSMQEGNVACYQDRKPLFPGGTCFPLSGDGALKKDEKLDQLSVIFGIIGTPSPQDVEAIGKANEYIASLGKMEGKPLKSIFPAADPAALDLLHQMLLFNPKRRCTAAQALEHDFFKGVRRKELEKTAAGPLTGPQFLEFPKVDLNILKRKTYEEVLWYRDHGGGGVSGGASAEAPSDDDPDSKPPATTAATEDRPYRDTPRDAS